MNSTTKKFYYFFLLASLVCFVFYLGFLYGNRERENDKTNLIDINNPNGQRLNSISKIEQRPVKGSVDSNNVTTFGQMYFLINDKNQTEIKIYIEGVPSSIKQLNGKAEVSIPNTLRVDVARRASSGGDTYEYQSISLNPDIQSTITFDAPENGLRSASFSGIIDSPIADLTGNKPKIERIVIRPTDKDIQNLFIDTDPDLPLAIRGNPTSKIPGQPAPFFWVKI